MGTITTAGQFCRTDGTTINCDQTAADIIGGAGTIGAINDLSDAYTDYVIGENMFLGHDGGNFGATDLDNTSLGVNALSSLDNTGANNNTAIGQAALLSLTSGDDNTAIGEDALEDLTTGSSNTALGTNASHKITTAQFNTAIGTNALANNIDGNGNTAIGSFAAGSASATDGFMERNTAVGSRAGFNLSLIHI